MSVNRTKSKSLWQRLKNLSVGDKAEVAKVETPAERQAWQRYLAALDRYEYEPLNTVRKQIRLLQLTGTGTRVQCQIRTVSIDSRTHSWPVYCALSYTWGDSGLSHAIFLNGQRMDVRSNLYHFLCERQQARVGDEELWIDQLCIDQSSIDERNHQVKLMGDIYKHAQSVVLWLGPESRHMLKILDDREKFGNKYYRDPPPLSPQQSEVITEQFPGNPYWERAWIVQEILLARQITVFTSAVSLPWSEVYSAVTSLFFSGSTSSIFETYEKVDAQGADVAKLMRVINIFATASSGQRYSELKPAITELTASEAGDKRDFVYAMLGIVTPTPKITVDYRKSVKEVYFDAVRVMLSEPEPKDDAGRESAYGLLAARMFRGRIHAIAMRNELRGFVDRIKASTNGAIEQQTGETERKSRYLQSQQEQFIRQYIDTETARTGPPWWETMNVSRAPDPSATLSSALTSMSAQSVDYGRAARSAFATIHKPQTMPQPQVQMWNTQSPQPFVPTPYQDFNQAHPPQHQCNYPYNQPYLSQPIYTYPPQLRPQQFQNLYPVHPIHPQYSPQGPQGPYLVQSAVPYQQAPPLPNMQSTPYQT